MGVHCSQWQFKWVLIGSAALPNVPKGLTNCFKGLFFFLSFHCTDIRSTSEWFPTYSFLGLPSAVLIYWYFKLTCDITNTSTFGPGSALGKLDISFPVPINNTGIASILLQLLREFILQNIL